RNIVGAPNRGGPVHSGPCPFAHGDGEKEYAPARDTAAIWKLHFRPHRDFVAVRIAEVKAPAAFEGLARDDFRAGLAHAVFHGIQIVRIEHDERSACWNDFALGIEAALSSVTRFERDV